MNKEIREKIINKLTKTQIFILCILWMLGIISIVLIVCLLAPEQLAAFFNIFNIG